MLPESRVTISFLSAVSGSVCKIGSAISKMGPTCAADAAMFAKDVKAAVTVP